MLNNNVKTRGERNAQPQRASQQPLLFVQLMNHLQNSSVNGYELNSLFTSLYQDANLTKEKPDSS